MTDRHRSAITGQYVTAEHAKTNPSTTVSESPCAECERLRGVVHTQGVAIDGYREEVERLAGVVGAVRAMAEGATYQGDPDDVGVYPLIRSQFAAEVLAVLDHHHTVRTVGDLTARHIGKRVRWDDGDEGVLDFLGAERCRFECLADLDGRENPRTYGAWLPLDTPCEVLP